MNEPICYLCETDYTNVVQSCLWECRQLSQRKRRLQALGKVLGDFGLNDQLRVDDVLSHWRNHSFPNPEPANNWKGHQSWLNLRVDGYTRWCLKTANAVQVLLLIARSPKGCVGVQEVADTFFGYLPEKNRARYKVAHRLISKMIDRFLLFRVRKGMPGELEMSQLYLGNAGAEVLEQLGYQEGRVYSSDERRELNSETLGRGFASFLHNKELELFWLDLQRAAPLDFSLGEIAELRLLPNPTEFWGSRHLSMTYLQPRKFDVLGKPVDANWRNLVPDGLGVLQFEFVNSPADSRLPERFSVPLIIEWDTGSRKVRDVSQQLESYAHLNSSGSVGKRFPGLGEVPVPVLLLTDTRAKEPTTRVNLISKRLRVLTETYPDAVKTPVFLASLPTWTKSEKQGLYAPVVSAWTGKTLEKFLPALFASLETQIVGGDLSFENPLRLERAGARQLSPKERRLINSRGLTPDDLGTDFRKRGYSEDKEEF